MIGRTISHCHSVEKLEEAGLSVRQKTSVSIDLSLLKFLPDEVALWKGADGDVPVLKQAKAEYVKLQ